MQQLTPAGQNLINDLSQRYNLSQDAVIHMLVAVNNGNGSMAQFNCPELGGSGQWMRGGMTMVGDMFNHGLKMTVDNLCNELASGLASMQVFPPVPRGSLNPNSWWPAELGTPSSSGSQNNIRYAVFPGRLAVELNGRVTVYDTLDHHISGVSQQQGGDLSLTFSSQYGTVSVSNLPIISGSEMPVEPNTNFAAPPPVTEREPAPMTESMPIQQVQSSQGNQPYSEHETTPAMEPADSHQNVPSGNTQTPSDIIELIEKLGQLKEAGILTEDEFNTKKSELLSRL